MSGVALHLSPHPDDELIGAPATLMALRDAGYRIVNLACSLGRPEQRERREAELREACRLAGFELRLPSHPAAISAGDDLAEAQAALKALASETIAELTPDVVLSPGPHDRHRGHEVVSRAVRDALRERPGEDASLVDVGTLGWAGAADPGHRLRRRPARGDPRRAGGSRGRAGAARLPAAGPCSRRSERRARAGAPVRLRKFGRRRGSLRRAAHRGRPRRRPLVPGSRLAGSTPPNRRSSRPGSRSPTGSTRQASPVVSPLRAVNAPGSRG